MSALGAYKEFFFSLKYLNHTLQETLYINIYL